jgi:SPP1 gp7 family putative phage head morphogenesis protein
MNVNDEIQDRTIAHAVYLERYKASEIRRIRKILNTQILPDLAQQIERRLLRIIERGSDTGPETTRRLKELERELTKLSNDLMNGLKQDVIIDMDDLTENELIWQANTVKQSLDFNLDLVVPSPQSVAKIIKTTSFAGYNLDQWFNGLSRATQRGVMAAVNNGIVQGETTDQIMRRIRGSRALSYTDGVFETTRRQAETVTRTTINHVSNQSRLEFFKENADILSGMKWIATLDSRTSVTCASLDGKVFPLDKGPRPPAHPNCRSTMTAVLKDADELGLKDIPAAKRASMNGQVPASTTFGEWLKRQPINVQNEVLGVKKAALFRKGDVPIERFVGSDLTPLTLKQLSRLEKKAFQKVGI